MKDLRSPKAKAKWESEQRERRLSKERLRAIAAATTEQAWGGVVIPWQTMDSCPFAAYDECYGLSGLLIVKDDKNSAIVRPNKRFGRPLRMVGEPEMVWTDDGPILTCKTEEYDDRPKWWFDWELIDEMGMVSERYGKPEIDFLPTHWLPLPSPLFSSI